jgi:hypothetical protein
MSELRSTAQRKSDVLATLGANGNAWLATATAGRPQLIAVSTWWDGAEVVVTTRTGSRTARNLTSTGAARLAFGTADDVTLVEAELAGTVPAAQGGATGEGFVAANGWDPKDEGPDWAYYRLRPISIQAHHGYEELEGRTVMRAGSWLA